MAFMISYTGIKLNLSDAGIPWVAPQNHSPRADFSFLPNPGDLPFVKPHTTKVACFLLPPDGGSPLGGSDSLSTIRHGLS